jgi:GNAT superfamily N-acetyltransferase
MLDIRELLLGEPRDFELCVSHIEALYAELFGPGGLPTLHDVQQLREQLAGRGPLHWAFLARDADGAAVGFMTLAESFAIFARGRYGIINELWVHPDARAQGVGAALLLHCKAFGRARGWRRIDVTAPPGPEWDRSFDFYRKHGFTPTGRKLKTLLG